MFSCYVFALPVHRKQKEFMEPAVSNLLQQFKTRFKTYPNVVQFDYRGEFHNTKVLPLL